MLEVQLDKEINLKVDEQEELKLRISQHRTKLQFIELNTDYRKIKELEIEQEEQQLDRLIKEIKTIQNQITP